MNCIVSDEQNDPPRHRLNIVIKVLELDWIGEDWSMLTVEFKGVIETNVYWVGFFGLLEIKK